MFEKRVGWLGGQVHARKCVEVAPSLLCSMVLGDRLDDARLVPRESLVEKDAPLQEFRNFGLAVGACARSLTVGGSIRL